MATRALNVTRTALFARSTALRLPRAASCLQHAHCLFSTTATPDKDWPPSREEVLQWAQSLKQLASEHFQRPKHVANLPSRQSLIQQPAPDFTAEAVLADNSTTKLTLSSYRGSYVILLFYPLDFTFVCPSELVAFNQRLSEFKSRNCEVLAVSVDSHFSHAAWKRTDPRQGGIGQIQYPMISDLTKDISRRYGVLTQDGTVSLRGLFLLDKEGIVRHAVVNDLPLGRSVDEALRMVDALQHFENVGEVCPANWKKGEKAMFPSVRVNMCVDVTMVSGRWSRGLYEPRGVVLTHALAVVVFVRVLYFFKTLRTTTTQRRITSVAAPPGLSVKIY